MSETPVTTIASQFFHSKTEPLDKSLQVQTLQDLNDPEKVAPYKGKLVHVIDAKAIYICGEFDPEHGIAAVWRPVLADDGKAFYLTSDNNEVFKITATRDGGNTGRIQVTYPAF